MSTYFWSAIAWCAICLLGMAGAVVIDSTLLACIFGGFGGMFAHYAVEIYRVERK